eukprot:6183432-Pleurochrysis_carterae.AAC.1
MVALRAAQHGAPDPRRPRGRDGPPGVESALQDARAALGRHGHRPVAPGHELPRRRELGQAAGAPRHLDAIWTRSGCDLDALLQSVIGTLLRLVTSGSVTFHRRFLPTPNRPIRSLARARLGVTRAGDGVGASGGHAPNQRSGLIRTSSFAAASKASPKGPRTPSIAPTLAPTVSRSHPLAAAKLRLVADVFRNGMVCDLVRVSAAISTS